MLLKVYVYMDIAGRQIDLWIYTVFCLEMPFCCSRMPEDEVVRDLKKQLIRQGSEKARHHFGLKN
jgi:hypothetical protein